VVTAVEVDLFPEAGAITGAAYWPAVHANRLLTTWLEWTRDAPWAATTTVRLMNLPEHPDVPPILRGGTTVCVDGAVLGGAEAETLRGRSARTAACDRPARARHTWRATTPAAVVETHMDPTEPFPVHGDHMLLGDLDEDALATLLRVAGDGSGSPLTNVEIRQLGGDERANRLANRLLGLGVRPDEPVAIIMARSVDIVVAFLAVVKTGGCYLPLHSAYPLERMRRSWPRHGRGYCWRTRRGRQAACRSATEPSWSTPTPTEERDGAGTVQHLRGGAVHTEGRYRRRLLRTRRPISDRCAQLTTSVTIGKPVSSRTSAKIRRPASRRP
jgi:hypothetical protein